MLFTHTKEIQAIYPTSKWDKIEKLEAKLQDEEDATLQPLIGWQLLSFLQREYVRLTDTYGLTEGIKVKPTEMEPNDLSTVRLIHTAQNVIIYAVMAHYRAEFSNSFNAGGGFNKMTAADYDDSSRDDMKDLDKEFFANMHRKIDLLLQALEMDASLPEPLFAEMWRTSRYFYLKSDLIFTRADIMQEFININNSRARYIELVPDIRYVQATYIQTRIDTQLWPKLLRFDSNRSKTVMDVYKRCAKLYRWDEPEPDAEQQEEITEHLDNALRLMRMAAGQFVLARTAKDHRSDYHSSGEMSMAQAVEYIAQSEWLNPKPIQEEQHEHHRHHHHKGFDNRRHDNAIFVFGGRVEY